MFTGAYTAIVTPFTKAGKVDEARLRDLVEFQIAGGVDGLVPCGTTGESPTLDYAEHDRVVEVVVAAAAKRCQVIAGTGSNCTAEAIALTKHAKAAGADASLQVAPYYNKPTQAGLYAHFRAIAEAAELPMILYNIPGRCGVDVANETTARLRRDLPTRVVGLKEATGNVDRVSQLRALVDAEFAILSGDDSLTLPMMSVGAVGVISVASNIVPREVSDLAHAAQRGEFAAAGRIHARLLPLFKDLFIETNPIPIKASLAMAGRIEETYRLPLVPMAESTKAQLRKTLVALGLVK
jgi:4-hydroxy-tetrahydrodipicolinate synthase